MISSQRQSTAEAKLQAARARLVLDRPFLGALLLHLPAHRSGLCATMGTDGRSIHYDPGYVDTLSLGQTQFMLAHQAMHCALGHFARRGHRVRSRWDIACDYAVNQLLADEGMTPPAGALVDARYRGLSAEEIYPSIAEGASNSTLDVHFFDGLAPGGATTHAIAGRLGERSSGEAGRDEGDTYAASDEAGWSDAAPHRRRHDSPALERLVTPQSLEDLGQQWQLRLAACAQQAERTGRLGASWYRVLGRLLKPTLPWHALLARHVFSRARDDYTFQKPSRREGAALLPRLHSTQLELFVVLDVSGSVSEAQLAEFAAEIEAIKSQVRARVTLHACDERLAPEGPWMYEAWEPIAVPALLKGGAGTDFRPVFDWIRNAQHRPDLLIYFTDAEGDFPVDAPTYPVIWLVKGPAPVPWGERIQLN